MKTEQFSRVEHLVETTRDEIDKLYGNLNTLKQLPEIVSASIPTHVERDLNCCYDLLHGINDTIEILQKCLYG